MAKQQIYVSPASEIIRIAAEDVMTASGIGEVNTWDEYITVTEKDSETGKTWEHTYPNPNYRG